MNLCPLCNRKFFYNVIENSNSCPVHGLFSENECENSQNYFHLKSSIFSMSDIIYSYRFFDKNKFIKELNQYGYNDCETIYNERMENLSKKIMYSIVLNTINSCEKYFSSLNISKVELKYDDGDYIYVNNGKYDPYNLLLNIKNIIDNQENKIKEYNKINNINYYMQIIYIIPNKNGENIIFTLDDNNEVKDNERLQKDIVNNKNKFNYMSTSSMLFYELLIYKSLTIIRKNDLIVNEDKKFKDKPYWEDFLNYSNNDFIEKMYNLILGRKSDHEGYNNYYKQLKNGTITRRMLIDVLWNSRENQQKESVSENIININYDLSEKIYNFIFNKTKQYEKLSIGVPNDPRWVSTDDIVNELNIPPEEVRKLCYLNPKIIKKTKKHLWPNEVLDLEMWGIKEFI